MILAVAHQGASAATVTPAGIAELPIRSRRDIGGVKINQVTPGLSAMGAVASRTSGFLLDNMKLVSGGLAVAAHSAEALVTENAVAVVAFVTKGIALNVFSLKINRREIAFQERSVNGAMRAARSTPSDRRTLVVVVAIGAGHQA